MTNSKQILKKIQEFLTKQKLSAIMLTNADDIFYTTGFLFRDIHEQEAVAIIRKNKIDLLVPLMFADQAKYCFKNINIILIGHKQNIVKTLLKKLKNKRCGFQTNHLIFSTYQKLKKAGIKLAALKEEFNNLRLIKNKQEIAKIKKAVSIADLTWEKVKGQIKPGKTEKQIAKLITETMEKFGADKEAFKTIVACGKNSAIPHYEPQNVTISKNQILLVDFGATKNGYNSDLSRTIFLGQSKKFRQIYNFVLAALENVFQNARANMTGSQIDQLARNFLSSHSLGKNFIHSTGHGLGINIHEPPFIAPKSQQVVPIRSVITVEPGIYLPNWGGIRIEDSAVMTKNGLQKLSQASYR